MLNSSWRAQRSAPIQTGLSWFALSRAFYLLYALILRTVQGFNPGNLLEMFQHFDADHFLRIAEVGYFAVDRSGAPLFDEAFFPGLPLLTRAVAFIGQWGRPTSSGYLMAGTLISWAGTLVAGVLLIDMVRRFVPPAAQKLAMHLVAWFWFMGPLSIFTVAVYTEGIFAALTLGAWLAARSDHWVSAAALCGVAGLFRVNSWFVIAGLLVMVVLAWRRGQVSFARALSRGSLLAVACTPPLAFMAYLGAASGDSRYWFSVQHVGYGREPRPFNYTLWRSWLRAMHGELWEFRYQQWLEFVALAVFALAVWQLCRWKRWDLVTFVGLTLLSLCTGPILLSLPRNLLDCFPAIIVIVVWLTRARTWVLTTVVTACSIVMLVNAATFMQGMWTG